MATYTATAYGQTFRRNSKRAFTHAVVSLDVNGYCRAENWCGNEMLAQKAAQRLASIPANEYPYIKNVCVVSATGEAA